MQHRSGLGKSPLAQIGGCPVACSFQIGFGPARESGRSRVELSLLIRKHCIAVGSLAVRRARTDQDDEDSRLQPAHMSILVERLAPPRQTINRAVAWRRYITHRVEATDAAAHRRTGNARSLRIETFFMMDLRYARKKLATISVE